MSKALVEKFFNERFVSLARQRLREPIEKQQGQLLVLTNLESFVSAIKQVTRKRLSNTQIQGILKKARLKAFKLEQDFKKKDPSRFSTIQSVLSSRLQNLPFDITAAPEAREVFIVTSFGSSVTTIKNFILDEIQAELSLRKTTRDKLGARIDRGHGVSGFAVSQAEVSQGLDSIQHLLEKDLSADTNVKALIDSFVTSGTVEITEKEKDLLNYITTKYQQIVNPKTGKLSNNYVSIVAYQIARENRGRDSALEKRIRDLFFGPFVSYVKSTLISQSHSNSLEEKIGNAVIEYLKPRIRVKNGKVVIRIDSKFVNTVLKSAGVTTTHFPKSASKSKATIQEKPRVRVKPGEKVLPDVRSFLGILNQKLSSQVAKNMGSPRLNYRTGRFAQSTRVTGIAEDRDGLPNIDYTYMRYPYEVFEFPGSGSPLALQGQRDPRDLIDKSIRDIMASFAITRFSTRRV